MYGKGAKLLYIGTDYAALPFGDNVGRNAYCGGNIILTFALCSACRSERPALIFGTEIPAICTVVFIGAEQPFKRYTERGGNAAEQRKIRLGNAPLPFRNCLQVDAQIVRKLLLRYSRSLP